MRIWPALKVSNIALLGISTQNNWSRVGNVLPRSPAACCHPGIFFVLHKVLGSSWDEAEPLPVPSRVVFPILLLFFALLLALHATVYRDTAVVNQHEDQDDQHGEHGQERLRPRHRGRHHLGCLRLHSSKIIFFSRPKNNFFCCFYLEHGSKAPTQWCCLLVITNYLVLDAYCNMNWDEIENRMTLKKLSAVKNNPCLRLRNEVILIKWSVAQAPGLGAIQRWLLKQDSFKAGTVAGQIVHQHYNIT